MDVADLLRRLLRRWRLALVVIVVAVVAAAISWTTAGSSEQSGAAVVIVPPPLGDAVSDQNPLLNLDNNLAQLATVLAAAMQSSAVSDALAARGATSSFTISTVTGTNPSFAQLSPQLVFTVTGSDAAGVQRTSSALVSEARRQLRTLQSQAAVPSSARASLVQVVPPTTAEAIGSGRLRAAGSIGIVIVVLGLLGVLLYDELRERRTRRVDQSWLRRRTPRRSRHPRGPSLALPEDGTSTALRSR